jgi:hypothetical protein
MNFDNHIPGARGPDEPELELTDDELRTIAIALDIAITGFKRKGPINVEPLRLVQKRILQALGETHERR